jgi:hypothetical protein
MTAMAVVSKFPGMGKTLPHSLHSAGVDISKPCRVAASTSILNPKSETISKSKCPKYQTVQHSISGCKVLVINILVVVICFEFRLSEFGFGRLDQYKSAKL